MLKYRCNYLCTIVISALIGSVLSGCAQPQNVHSLTFLDPNFKRCVMAQGKQDIRQITTLKCRHLDIRDAREIRYLIHLKTLDLSSNQLTYLDVSHNQQLYVLSVEHNKLAHINVTHNAQLQILNVSFNHLKALDVSHNPLLTYLNYDYVLINNIDISRNPYLVAPFYTIDGSNGPKKMAE